MNSKTIVKQRTAATQYPAIDRTVISPLPMQYLGGKGRIAKWIVSEVKNHFPASNKFFDIFAGTGTVALHAVNEGYDVSANDLEPYSYSILKALLRPRPQDLSHAIKSLQSLKSDGELLSSGRGYMRDFLHQEMELFFNVGAARFNWEKYRYFCKNTPIIKGSVEEITKLKSANQWNLFTRYYSNTYFGVRQCMQLDAIRELAEQVPVYKDVILAATISAMTYGVSSTTHLAQYLRPDSENAAIHLVKRRQFDFIEQIQQRLHALEEFDLWSEKSDVYTADFRDITKKIIFDKQWIVYADPPYFKEHYSRYYHVLNTFLLYDFPFLTYNSRIEATTEGRYREGRNVSDFGKKASVCKAFYDLFSVCNNTGCKLAVSYADTSLVKKDVLLSLAKTLYLDVTVIETDLAHSSQGQSGRTKYVKEYLFLISSRKYK